MNSFVCTPHLSEDGEASSRSGGVDSEQVPMFQASECQSHWYAVRTYARHEKSVLEHLKLRNVETFLPLYEKVHRWKNGCNVRVELPLFPSYLFVDIDLRNRARVLEAPGTISLVGTSRQPWPLSDFQIESLRDNLPLRKFEPHAYLVAGQNVRIIAGPLVGLTGILLRKNAALRVVLALDQIMQGVSVEVDASEVEPTSPSAPLQ